MEYNIIKILLENKQGLSKSSLIETLKVSEKSRKIFKLTLLRLYKRGVVVKVGKRNNRYALNPKDNLVIGYYNYHSKGFGFVKNNKELNNNIDEIFIAPKNINYAMDGDIVIVRIIKDQAPDYKAEGIVLAVLQRSNRILVGTYMEVEGEEYGFVIPDNPKLNIDVFIGKNKNLNAKSYDKVVASINTDYSFIGKHPEGRVKELIGFKDEIGIDYLSIITEHRFKDSFPPKVIQQVDRMKDDIENAELNKRLDLTEKCIFTIDGEDSLDLDDAISIEKLDNGNYRLGVHIADVTHYVKEDTALDKEAFSRGTSVYMINKVIPMLPKKLSNGLCSLNPLETKLTLTVFMDINSNGTVVSREICESYINSKSKLCYSNVSDFIEDKGELNVHKDVKGTAMEDEIKKSLKFAAELQEVLNKKRMRRGMLNFNINECKITLDDNDKPVKISIYDRRISNRIIEEFMIVTNETVAEFFCSRNIPFVYRIHEKPKEEKLQVLFGYLTALGYELPDDISAKSLQGILIDIDENQKNAVNLLLLQSMQQARYKKDELGHFALAAEYYSHFTSPIRRYPDLQIHRIIKDYINKRLNSVRIEKYKEKVEATSRVSSKRERQAQSAELEYDNLKKMEYIQDRIGEVYSGTITALNKTHCRIVLDNTIEGELSISKITDDNYSLLRESCSLVGLSTGKEITIGDRIKVSVQKVLFDKQIIVFNFVEFNK